MSEVISIFIYYFVIIIAYNLFRFSDKTSIKRKKIIFLVLGVLLLSVFAGIRGLSVGTDTYAMVSARFERVTRYDSLVSLVNSRLNDEPFISAIGYVVRSYTNDYRAFLFVLQLLTVCPIAIAAYKLRDRVEIKYFMLVYMLIFYQWSFNIIKQCAAVTWLVLFVVEFFDKKYVRAIICAAIASLFHESIIIGYFFCIVVYIFSRSRSKIIRTLLIFVTIGAGVFAIMNWQRLGNWIIDEELIKGDYGLYLDVMAGEAGTHWTSFHFRTVANEVVRVLEILILIMCCRNSERKNDRDVRFYSYMVFLGFIIYSVLNIIFHMYIGDRFSLYLECFQIPLYSLLIGKDRIDANLKSTTLRFYTSGPKLCLYGCFVYNFIIYMIFNYGKTLPYVF